VIIIIIIIIVIIVIIIIIIIIIVIIIIISLFIKLIGLSLLSMSFLVDEKMRNSGKEVDVVLASLSLSLWRSMCVCTTFDHVLINIYALRLNRVNWSSLSRSSHKKNFSDALISRLMPNSIDSKTVVNVEKGFLYLQLKFLLEN